MLANLGAHLNDIALWGADLDHAGPVAVEGTGKFPPKGNLWDVNLSLIAIALGRGRGVRPPRLIQALRPPRPEPLDDAAAARL